MVQSDVLVDATRETWYGNKICCVFLPGGAFAPALYIEGTITQLCGKLNFCLSPISCFLERKEKNEKWMALLGTDYSQLLIHTSVIEILAAPGRPPTIWPDQAHLSVPNLFLQGFVLLTSSRILSLSPPAVILN